eukprot:XP_015576780.1 putative tRNA 2'-phosphotransferase [Ricinus communis]
MAGGPYESTGPGPDDLGGLTGPNGRADFGGLKEPIETAGLEGSLGQRLNGPSPSDDGIKKLEIWGSIIFVSKDMTKWSDVCHSSILSISSSVEASDLSGFGLCFVRTVKSESLLKPIILVDEVPVCVHGTYKKNLGFILEYGLKRMQRLHVHFSCGLPTDGEVISDMRRNVNVLIYLDMKKALEDGMKLYISDNRVILTESFDGVVPVKYFEKIESWPDRLLMSFPT